MSAVWFRFIWFQSTLKNPFVNFFFHFFHFFLDSWFYVKIYCLLAKYGQAEDGAGSCAVFCSEYNSDPTIAEDGFSARIQRDADVGVAAEFSRAVEGGVNDFHEIVGIGASRAPFNRDISLAFELSKSCEFESRSLMGKWNFLRLRGSQSVKQSCEIIEEIAVLSAR